MKIKVGKRYYSLSYVLKKYVQGGIYILLAKFLYLRPFSHKKKRIILTGHRFNGNLKAFADWMLENDNSYELMFFTDDPDFYEKTKNSWNDKVKLYSVQNLSHLKLAAEAQVVLSSHGLTFFAYWKSNKNRPIYAEVWHGAGFKNRTLEDSAKLYFYDAIFVSSPTFKEFHKGWGYKDKQLFVTGYAQVDSLVKTPTLSEIADIKKKFGISTRFERIILYAPTWNSKDSTLESPFPVESDQFLRKLNEIAQKNNSLIAFLPHLNSSFELPAETDNLKIISSNGELDIKPFLHITDLLITDWSSIYTDFLVLDKPTIFLDTEPTFFGFTLTPEDRAGSVVKDLNELETAMQEVLNEPENYKKRFADKMADTKARTWGETLDGKSAERYYNVINQLVDEKSN